MLQRALDIYRSKFMPALQPRKNSKRVAPIPPPSLTNTVSQEASLMDLVNATANNNNTSLTVDALSAQNALYEKAQVTSPTMTNMSGTTESLDFAECFSLADEEPEDEAAMNAAAAAVFCDLLLQEPMTLFSSSDTEESNSTRMNSTSSYSSESTACTPSPTSDQFTTDFFDQFMMPTIDDPFYYGMNSSATTAANLSKLYNTTIEDTFTAGNMLDPLF
jgi:hypothetical protein